jgi:hypothetical protein
MQSDCLEDSYHVNIIINLLMRFPEIFTVTYSLSESSYSLSYMVKTKVGLEQFKSFSCQLEENLEAYRFFKKKEHYPVSVQKKYYCGFTQLETVLSEDHLIGEEISLITRLIKEQFGKTLISELRPEDVDLLEEGPATWEEMLSILSNRKANSSVKNLFAFRDSGKVYVFDK